MASEHCATEGVTNRLILREIALCDGRKARLRTVWRTLLPLPSLTSLAHDQDCICMNSTSLLIKQAEALAAVPGIRHGFFGRGGGVSIGIYGSLNCGLGSNDDRALVLENRRRVSWALNAPEAPLLTCHQVHSATAVIVDAPWTAESQPRADALVTRTKGLVLGALAADCAPILFADPKAGVIAAAHAGWRGALDGIVEATIAKMQTLGCDVRDIRAAVGPCIGRNAYEVGPEFSANFRATNDRYGTYFHTRSAGGRAHFDLPRFVADQLTAAGCGAVESSHICTYSNPADYFSFRRSTHAGEPDYGRQISAIVLT
jgi:polyphenol oxidase